MSLCLNPECENINPSGTKFCVRCGNRLLLGDRYRAVEFLGEGGFGRTFKSIDEQRLGTFCVIKQFLPQLQGGSALQKATELFKQEAVRLKDLGKHPQIPDLLAFFEQDGRLYLVQEFIDGKDLLKELQQNGRFDEEKIRNLLNQLLPVLEFLHQKNVIHRDIKPDNIIRDANNRLMLIDFGVSKQLTGTVLTRAGTNIGTPGYAAPEQLQGHAFPASDLYSLGVTCIRLLTGCLLEEQNGNYVDKLFDFYQMKWVWRSLVNINNDLAMILDKMISVTLGDRYQSASEVLQMLSSKSVPNKQVRQSIPNISTPNAQFSQSPVSGQTQIILESERDIDYTHLCNLLADRLWKEADQKTYDLVLRAANTKERYLTGDDWLKFPCKDFRTIDQLWMKYSDGRFGFSVQKQIWESKDVGGHPNADSVIKRKFAIKVGWKKGEKWLDYSDLTFSTAFARFGHLPAAASWGWWGIWGVGNFYAWGNLLDQSCTIYQFFSRVKTCKL